MEEPILMEADWTAKSVGMVSGLPLHADHELFRLFVKIKTILETRAMLKLPNLKLIFFVSIILTTTAAVAYASGEPCYRNGEWYPNGSRLGDYICVDGQWLPYR